MSQVTPVLNAYVPSRVATDEIRWPLESITAHQVQRAASRIDTSCWTAASQMSSRFTFYRAYLRPKQCKAQGSEEFYGT